MAAPVRQMFSRTGGSIRRNLEYFGAVRGRLGYAMTPTFLLYATGGFAYEGASGCAELQQSLTPSTFDEASVEGKLFQRLTGFAGGGVVEAAISANVTAKRAKPLIRQRRLIMPLDSCRVENHLKVW